MTLQQKLLKWFDQNARPLPWRKHYRPYEVWISEIMLQQTQMETVLPYFERWVKTFPDIDTLAKSDEQKVLKLWQGLGYYSRARNLHQTAKTIMKQHGGFFPSDHAAITKLKGIGRYTAGAIASIAFNQETPIVDGNILRVLSRIYAIDKPIDVEKNKEIFWKLQEKLIPKGRARHFNQALMELGALVCSKQNPSCPACPVRNFCKAFEQDRAEKYPVRKNKKKMVRVEAAALVIENNGKYFIHKRPVGKIMGGLWEFPEWKTSQSKKLVLLTKKDLGINIMNLKSLGKIKRNYTHHLETLHVFKTVYSGIPHSKWPSAWITKKEFNKHPFSSAHAKITQMIK